MRLVGAGHSFTFLQNKNPKMRIFVAILLTLTSSLASAETIFVKYHGSVILESFACSSVNENSDVTRICYDVAERYLILRLRTTYYHYCSVDMAVVQGLKSANSKRQFFDARIRGSGSDGPFDCRTHPIPAKYRL